MSVKSPWTRRWALAVSTTLALSACGEADPDRTPPTVGAAVAPSGNAAQTMEVSWGAATDDRTPAADLRYQVMYARSGDLSTVDTALSNGLVAQAWRAGPTTAVIGGLDADTVYVVAVLVEDAEGNRSMYPIASHRTGVAVTKLTCAPTAPMG